MSCPSGDSAAIFGMAVMVMQSLLFVPVLHDHHPSDKLGVVPGDEGLVENVVPSGRCSD